MRNYWVLKPNSKLAYLLGIKYGDLGLVSYKRKGIAEYRIGLTAKDEDFVSKFRDTVCSLLKKKTTNRIHLDKGYYCCYICSKDLFHYLSLGLEAHKPVIEKFPADFLRGFFDSEGNADQRSKICCLISASNINLELLKYVQHLLKKLGIASQIYPLSSKQFVTIFGRICRAHQAWQLKVTSIKEARKFWKKVGFSIRRKQEPLDSSYAKYEKNLKAFNEERTLTFKLHASIRNRNSLGQFMGGKHAFCKC